MLRDAEFLFEDFQYGFHIPFQGPRLPCFSNKLKLVVGFEHVVRDKVQKELQEGRVLGPFLALPIPNLRVSPLGIVPKKTHGKFRLIHPCLILKAAWSIMASQTIFVLSGIPCLIKQSR